MDKKPKFLKFTVSGKLTKLLGQDSVSTDIAALFELVKNAYDADATQVKITFEHLDIIHESYKKLDKRYELIITKLKSDKPGLSINELDVIAKQHHDYITQLQYVEKLKKRAKITIEDNGKGMSVEQVENKWMNIGVSKEREEIITKGGRRVVGEKGVGRFAVEKLAHITIITSKLKGSNTTVIATIDWDKFEKSKQDMREIEIPMLYKRKDVSDHGVTIELIDLREDWLQPKIKKIIDELSMLVLPEEIESKFPFSIKVYYKGLNKIEEFNVQSEIFKKAPYKFVAILTKDSTIKFSSTWYKNEQVIPNKRGLNYPGLVEQFHFLKEDETGKSVSSMARCGPVKFVFYGFPFDPSGRKLGWTEWYGESRVGRIMSDVEYYSGIKIYRDGFRVRPYGELDDDWLSLDTEARTSAGKLPNKNVIGWITISSDENPSIIDTTTREKIIENESFQDLKDFVRQSLNAYYKFAESLRQEVIKKEKASQVPKLIQKIGNIISESSSIPKQTKTQLLSSLSQIESSLTNEASTVQLERESLMDELNAFRNLASLGITTGVVSHEIRDYLRNILLHTGALERELKKNHIDSSQLKQSVSYINPSVDNLRKYMALVSSFTSTIGSRKKEFRQKRNLNLHEEVRKIINGLQGIFTASEIIVENGIPHNFPKLRMYQADLQSILFNLMSNSIKSLKLLTAERQNLPKSQKNKIRISAKVSKNDLTITFSDNGIGIAEIDRSYVFDLFWTRTATQETVRSGSGLGLPIIKEIVRDYGGEVIIEKEAEFNQGVTFKIVLPRRVAIN